MLTQICTQMLIFKHTHRNTDKRIQETNQTGTHLYRNVETQKIKHMLNDKLTNQHISHSLRTHTYIDIFTYVHTHIEI